MKSKLSKEQIIEEANKIIDKFRDNKTSMADGLMIAEAVFRHTTALSMQSAARIAKEKGLDFDAAKAIGEIMETSRRMVLEEFCRVNGN